MARPLTSIGSPLTFVGQPLTSIGQAPHFYLPGEAAPCAVPCRAMSGTVPDRAVSAWAGSPCRPDTGTSLQVPTWFTLIACLGFAGWYLLSAQAEAAVCTTPSPQSCPWPADNRATGSDLAEPILVGKRSFCVPKTSISKSTYGNLSRHYKKLSLHVFAVSKPHCSRSAG